MSPPDGTTFGKRALVELSHAIERFARAARPGAPLVVIAMFQRLSYLSRATDVYGEIAARADVTLVALVEDLPPRLPPGVRHVLLGEGEEPAQEWEWEWERHGARLGGWRHAGRGRPGDR